MSISCNIYLPNDTRLTDVIDVIGILLGHNKYKQYIDDKGYWCCKVDNVTSSLLDSRDEKRYIIFPKTTFEPGLVTIKIRKNFIDNIHHMGYYHFEDSEYNMRVISGGSSKFWKVIGKGLVEFFGGFVDYDDCDDIVKDFEKEKPRSKNNSEDGKEWQLFEQDKFNLKSLE